MKDDLDALMHSDDTEKLARIGLRLHEENAKLRAVADAARKSVRFCPAVEEHGTEDDCRIYACKEMRVALAALDATAAPRCKHGVHGTDCVECYHREAAADIEAEDE